MTNKIYLSLFCFCFLVYEAAGQDSTKKQTVEITSAFKPVLKNAVKQNFTATPPAPDANPAALNYNIPIRNIFLNLQPVALKPLALAIDTTGEAHNSNYIKLGYGNFNTPLAEAGITLGDGKKTNFNLFASHLSQNGKLPAQRYSTTGLSAHLNTLVNKIEVYGKLGYDQQSYYLYGPDPAFVNTKEDSLKKPYQTFTVRAGLRNAFVNKFGVSYNPDLNISVFGDTRASETNAKLDVPLELRIGTNYSVTLRGNADFTTFKPTGLDAYQNNVYFLNAAVNVKNERFKIKAGIRPTWDNGKLNVLPDLLVDFKIKDVQAIFIAGWTGHVRKNTYEYLVSQNPWINQPVSQFNTRITELFGGLKGSAVNSVNYRVQVGFVEYLSLPLFVNNAKPSLFTVRRESKLQAVHSQAELGFVFQDQFNASVKMDLYNFVGQDTERDPWHVIPLQLAASFRWKPVKKVLVKSDVFAWGGPKFLNASGISERLQSVFDLNAGIEFTVAKNIAVWTQFNNIFNNAYERWNNYPQLGFQFIGGIKLNFDQNH
jgi:hypothetical protein